MLGQNKNGNKERRNGIQEPRANKVRSERTLAGGEGRSQDNSPGGGLDRPFPTGAHQNADRTPNFFSILNRDLHTNWGGFEVQSITDIPNTKQMKKIRQLLTLAKTTCCGGKVIVV